MTDGQQIGNHRKLGRFGPIMFIGQLGWAALGAAAAPLLAVLVAGVAPADKVGSLALITTVGGVGATITMIFAGYLSDHTVSRYGPRVPWIIAGSLVASAGFAAMGLAKSILLLTVVHLLYQIGINLMLGAFNAIPADYLDDSVLGKASAFGGAGYLVAQMLGSTVGATFVGRPHTGLAVIAPITVICSFIVVKMLPPHPHCLQPEKNVSGSRALIWEKFRLPHDSQFWWVFVGRFLFIISLFMTIQFQLYIATDRMGLGTSEAGRLVALNGVLLAIGAALATIITGPWSDHVHRRRPFVIAAPLLGALGILPLILFDQAWALSFFAITGGLAFGSYLSVDGALMIEVLPQRKDSARDLGLLSAANSLPMVLAPGLGALLVKTVGYQGDFIIGAVLAILGSFCITRVTRVR